MSSNVNTSQAVPGMADAMAFLGSFLLVIAILVALLYGLRWLQRRQLASSGGRLRLAESLFLGTGHRIVVVEVDGESFLVGISPQQFTLIGRIGAGVGEQSSRSQ